MEWGREMTWLYVKGERVCVRGDTAERFKKALIFEGKVLQMGGENSLDL